MNSDKTPMPTDAEIDAVVAPIAKWQFPAETRAQDYDRAIARAVLAKWGSPVVAVEPVAWIPPEREGAYHASLTITAYRQPMAGWEPLYRTPQPTQAQAGAPEDDGFNPTPGAIYQSHGHGTVTFKTMDFERGEPIYHFDTARGIRYMKREQMLRDIQRPGKEQAGAVPLTDEHKEDLYCRLESLSKLLEGKGLIDEHETPTAYSTILDAMNSLRFAAEGTQNAE